MSSLAHLLPRVWCGAVLSLLFGLGLAARAAEEGVAPPPALRAQAVLAAHCARCHQADRMNGAVPAGHFGNVLDLEEVAADPALVRPQLPDGSALYARMLHRHRPLANYQEPSNGGPSAEEIAAVRDWIDSLDKAPGRCAARVLLTPQETARLMQHWLKRLGQDRAKEARFVTLARFHNACASDREMAGYRLAVEKLLAGLSRATAPVRIDALGDGLAMLAFSLGDIGWSVEDWEKLAGTHPKGSAIVVPEDLKRATASMVPVVRGDWLAFAAPHPATDTPPGGDPALRLHGVDPVAALARRYDRPVDLASAAAEQGVEASDLAGQLERLEGEARPLALRLAQGLLGRADVERLFLALRHEPPEPAAEARPSVAETAPAGLSLAIWSERTSYKVGDLATFHVLVDADCYLTVVNVDTAGRATVIFPNDMEPGNLLKAGQPRTLPGATAPYQLRFTETGRETLVATCSSHDKAPPGIAHDFERQRFTLLGDWRKFVAMASGSTGQMQRVAEKARPARHRRMRLRKRTEPKPAEVRPAGPEFLAHTAIVVGVE